MLEGMNAGGPGQFLNLSIKKDCNLVTQTMLLFLVKPGGVEDVLLGSAA